MTGWYHVGLKDNRYRQVLIENAQSGKFRMTSRLAIQAQQNFVFERSLRETFDRQRVTLCVVKETRFARSRRYGFVSTSVFGALQWGLGQLYAGLVAPPDDALRWGFCCRSTIGTYSLSKLSVSEFESSARALF